MQMWSGSGTRRRGRRATIMVLGLLETGYFGRDGMGWDGGVFFASGPLVWLVGGTKWGLGEFNLFFVLFLYTSALCFLYSSSLLFSFFFSIECVCVCVLDSCCWRGEEGGGVLLRHGHKMRYGGV